ncbi:MAG: VCBS repeat-containing protein, partial [Saprospiraceae bacterium]|nr:VCBS repeat-containing protein [Saprospiraceae bacterium]
MRNINTSAPQKSGFFLAATLVLLIGQFAGAATLDAGAPPTLGAYPNTSVVAGQNTTVTPDAAPTGATSATATANTNFTGVLSVNPATGVVTVTDAKQAGTYTVTVTAFDGGGSTTATFTLTVNDPNCSQGQFRGNTTVGVEQNPRGIALGDFNGDGKQDFAAANSASNSVSIRFGDGLGGFSGSTNVSVGTGPYSVAVADFNGDGKQDFAAANGNSSNTVSIRLGDGAGGFTGSTTVTVGSNPFSVAVGDFNDDGIPDIATANYGSATVSIRLGDGAGGFTGSTNVAVGSFPYSVAVGDFNGDGNQDIAAANYSSNTVSIRLGDGAGGLTGSTNVAVGASPTSVAVGDFNGDGNQDIAAANSLSNTVSIRLGDGTGAFTGSTDVATGGTCWFVAVGDFNGDGIQDFAAANYGSSSVSIRLGDGTGNFPGSINVASITGPICLAVGDFNNDSIQDFAAANLISAAVSIRLGGANEINLRGNGMDIADGDNTPDPADHTNFGQGSGSPITRTFTIQNTGNTNLTLAAGAITISGANSSLFTVSNITLPATISGPSGTLNFNVTYTPGANTGVHTATVHIASADCDEADYDFAIQATTTGSIVSAQTGPWHIGSTWVGGVVPTSTDNVTILATHTVTLTTTAQFNDLTIDAGGALLQPNTGTLDGASITNNGTLAFTQNIGGVTTHTVESDITNNGILNWSGGNMPSVSGKTIFNYGTFNIPAANAIFGLDVVNKSGGTVNRTGIGNQIIPTVFINEAGAMLNVLSGATLTFTDSLHNSGTVDVPGTLALQGGSHRFEGGTFGGTGFLNFNGTTTITSTTGFVPAFDTINLNNTATISGGPNTAMTLPAATTFIATNTNTINGFTGVTNNGTLEFIQNIGG